MAVIHHTTMAPSKLELLASWLPTRPWYLGGPHEPELSRVGGFRLDDPHGTVGLEFMVVTDASGDRSVTYHVPLSYRGGPLEGAEDALIGTSEHGVLGRRWVYDAPHDPVWVTQVLALFQGRAEPQHQSTSHTPDPSVTHTFTGADLAATVTTAAVTATDDGNGSHVLVGAAGAPGAVTVVLPRILTPGPRPAATSGGGVRGEVTAGWQAADGGEHRAPFLLLRDAGS